MNRPQVTRFLIFLLVVTCLLGMIMYAVAVNERAEARIAQAERLTAAGLLTQQEIANSTYDSTATAVKSKLQASNAIIGAVTSTFASGSQVGLNAGNNIIGQVTTTNGSLVGVLAGNAIIGAVTATLGAAVPAGNNLIGSVTSTITSLPSLAAGNSIVGSFTPTLQLPLVAGNDIIGSVTSTITSLPSLAAGNSIIGAVTSTITSLPSLAAGNSIIGAVTSTMTSLPSLAAGNDIIGAVTATLASGTSVALGAGNNIVGTFTPSITTYSVNSLPSGNAIIGAVTATVSGGDVSLNAGNNIIGSVTVTQLSALPSGAGYIGYVTATNTLIAQPIITMSSQVPLITAGAYSANDAVGNILTFTLASRSVGAGGILQTVLIQDKDSEEAGLELWLFNATFTQAADNAAFAVGAADMGKLIGVIPISTADYHLASATSIATIRNVGLAYTPIGATSIYGQLKCTGTPTFGTTADLTVTLTMLWP